VSISQGVVDWRSDICLLTGLAIYTAAPFARAPNNWSATCAARVASIPGRRQFWRSDLLRAGEAQHDHERHPTPVAGGCGKCHSRSEEPPTAKPRPYEPEIYLAEMRQLVPG